jgi:hypothetical protein
VYLKVAYLKPWHLSGYPASPFHEFHATSWAGQARVQVELKIQPGGVKYFFSTAYES